MGSSYAHDDGMEGGADPCGSQGGGPDVRTGHYDGDADGDFGQPGAGEGPGEDDYAGSPGGGSDVSPPAGSGTGGQPRPEEWIK